MCALFIGKWKFGLSIHKPWAWVFVSYSRMLLSLSRYLKGLILPYLFMVNH